uniref:CobW C-terminal domain-containing protein n=1 Tax=Timspurckia oligopyrenoides TaxID=708627 RepID=A0A7S0ZDY0_9RHOD|mmetsp:Transcript_1474/g.2653  ORF Transcript_1474/g.2653 Transcript_1474/m.2653 type:complete len:490 (+) Transcript_1474:84-1553(+)|eukprot:CAMPEP_0182445726 /NCGR_PEP_ID=MMETSP1172-20130603/3750_1 /TAXON_ID=708627 /ORGANISM="Timspurckia oligopyrenoides, Strain CCMP3278" /LENGTH=489 /DNA_ID=CAMNT_0024641541 /DNA_START=44 /DNA_END=1513 /DNA_ORIENTATION=-
MSNCPLFFIAASPFTSPLTPQSSSTTPLTCRPSFSSKIQFRPLPLYCSNTDPLPQSVLDQISALDILQKDTGSLKVDTDVTTQSTDEDHSDSVIQFNDKSHAESILKSIPRGNQIPVTLVTGFLGAGKTTLVNYLLKADHGLKIAVLVNEFGEIDIDSQIIERQEWDDSMNADLITLNNGCICCSINDSFQNAVQAVLDREEKFDYLVVETTGIADPVPIVNTITSSDLENKIRLDSVVTLVDAESFDTKKIFDSDAAYNQIEAADTILLSKTDLIDNERVNEVVKAIEVIRPGARIIKSKRGKVPLNYILDVGYRLESDENQSKSDQKVNKHDHDHDHEHSHEHGPDCGPDCGHESHSHEKLEAKEHVCDENCDHGDEKKDGKVVSNHLESDGFQSTSFETSEKIDSELFMDNFLVDLPQNVYRSKGVLYFKGYDGKRYVFQLTGRRFRFEEMDYESESELKSQLVVIGKNLDLEKLKASFQSCIAQK